MQKGRRFRMSQSLVVHLWRLHSSLCRFIKRFLKVWERRKHFEKREEILNTGLKPSPDGNSSVPSLTESSGSARTAATKPCGATSAHRADRPRRPPADQAESEASDNRFLSGEFSFCGGHQNNVHIKSNPTNMQSECLDADDLFLTERVSQGVQHHLVEL